MRHSRRLALQRLLFLRSRPGGHSAPRSPRRPIRRRRSSSPSRRRAAALDRRTRHRRHVVGDEKDRAAFLLEVPKLLEALLLERIVADREDFVEERMSASTCIASAKASRTLIPEEKFFSCRSANSSRSAKAMIASLRPRICVRVRPSRVPFRRTFSRAVRSSLNPTPISRNGDSRPATLTVPESLG